MIGSMVIRSKLEERNEGECPFSEPRMRNDEPFISI